MKHATRTTIVFEDQVAEIQVEAADTPRAMRVTASLDRDRQWSFEEPGWRELGYGVAAGGPYWWSARHVVTLPTRLDEAPIEILTDEDILFVFRLAHDQWLVVCETSVRLIADGNEQSRLELADVVVEASRRGSRLHVRDARGFSTTISVAEGRLVA